MSITNDLTFVIEKTFINIKHYWKKTFILVFLGAIFTALYKYFSGLFIESVSNIGQYLAILFLGMILKVGFIEGFDELLIKLSNTGELVNYIIFGKERLFFVNALIVSLIYAYINVFSFILPLLFLIKGSLLNKLVFASLFTLIVLLMSYAYAFAFAPLVIFTRSEAKYVTWTIMEIVRVIIPAEYLLSAFWFYRYAFINPPAVAIEEFRRFLMYGKANLHMLALATIAAVIYLVIGYILYRWAINKGRKSGWIALK